MDVRRAALDDAAAIAAIEAAAAHHPWAAAQVEGALRMPGACAWVARDGEAAIGHLIGLVVLDEAELSTLAVLPSARRRGVAAALLHAAYQGWRDAGATEAFLEVRRDNFGAIALYEGDGWTSVGCRRGYYADGCDAWLMRRAIGG